MMTSTDQVIPIPKSKAKNKDSEVVPDHKLVEIKTQLLRLEARLDKVEASEIHKLQMLSRTQVSHLSGNLSSNSMKRGKARKARMKKKRNMKNLRKKSPNKKSLSNNRFISKRKTKMNMKNIETYNDYNYKA